jgi:hypothetical protein
MEQLSNEKGQGTLEYVVIAAAVIGLAVMLVQKMNPKAQARITEIETGLNGQ